MIIGAIVVAFILIAGTLWMGRSASQDTDEAVRAVSLLYLDELAGRREQVVAANLQSTVDDLRIAVGLMSDDDLDDVEHLQAYQARMKQLYGLEKFAFVDSGGLIYTSEGMQDNIGEYDFDYKTLSQAEISIKDLDTDQKKVVVAIPVQGMAVGDDDLTVCFGEIDMQDMLKGVSVQSNEGGATFCNIYTSNGIPLTNTVLAGQAGESNLFDAMRHAEFEEGYSVEGITQDFGGGNRGVASFTYNGVTETLYYVPVDGVDWMLTYLISESVIGEEIGAITEGTIMRSIIQSVVTVLALLAMFGFIFMQMRKSAQLTLEREASEAANRAKQEELEQRLTLQEELLEKEKLRVQQDSMITALSSDYRGVYYINLDTDEGICYRADPKLEGSLVEGQHFGYRETFASYAAHYVAEEYRGEFMRFIEPDNVRAGLERNVVITLRYLTQRYGKESYEMLRMAGVRDIEDRDDHIVHVVGAGFTDIDQEMRESMAKNQALNDALAVAEEANKAKTAFLSNMSHEIRTPMNAIIGLDSIALNDPGISDTTRDQLQKIGASAQHLLSIINDILDMSRIESGRMVLKNEEFSFPKLVEQVNTIFSGQCAEKGLVYDCCVKGHVDDYYIGDNMKLRQVLINILGNAVKFTPEGGSVNLGIERIAQFDGKTTLRFVISDTGIGMSKEFLPRIFDTFSQEDSSATNKYGSSGLGLAITKSIVEMMNGNIEVDSEKGVGTTFTVTVTLRDSDRAPGDDDDDEIHPQQLSVLIVDDDSIACEHARIVLENVGIASDSALSGSEAIEMVRLRHARREPYNLILIDWKMPDMDGVETTRRIRSIIGDETAVIILTAYKWDDILEEALQAGVDSFLAKPLFASSVLEHFKEALKKRNVVVSDRANKADLAGRRILLAEDVPINAEIMQMVLQARDIQVELAENGRVAVQMFESKPEGYYDAILMDMRMPEMDGLQATTAIRSLDRPDVRSIPIIALTANAFDEDVQRSLQAGLNAHLSKPVEPELLYETLESLIPE